MDRDLQHLSREIENLIVQFEQISDWVEEIEYDGAIINVREFFQRLISRYQFQREENARNTPPPSPLLPQIDLSGTTVVTIEDNEDISTLLTIILQAAGAEVSCVSSAPAAIELLKSRSFTVMVSDIGMPEMSGLEMMRRLRAAGNHTPSVALSAFATDEDKEAALDAGFDLFVAKPVHPAQLVAGIARLVSGA